MFHFHFCNQNFIDSKTRRLSALVISTTWPNNTRNFRFRSFHRFWLWLHCQLAFTFTVYDSIQLTSCRYSWIEGKTQFVKCYILAIRDTSVVLMHESVPFSTFGITHKPEFHSLIIQFLSQHIWHMSKGYASKHSKV